jgi:HEAT repeat protein
MTKRVTAVELLAQLEKDPDFVARREAQERAVKSQAEALRVEEAPLVGDLRAAGYDVASVWDLVNSSLSYVEAVPLLLSHLLRSYSSPIREGIARALGTRGAVAHWASLLDRYQSEEDLRVKDGLAAALAATADDSVIDSVIALVRDSGNGPSRLLLLRALAKSQAPKARETLVGLRGDPFFAKEAKFLLRTSK